MVEKRNGHYIYPMPDDARLGNFDRFDFYHRRFLRSDFYRNCITNKREAAGFYGFALWCHAFDETPVGTIPIDEGSQAHMVGLGADLRRWRAVGADARYGFLPVMRPCGTVIEGRLTHELLLAVALNAWSRDQGYQEYKRAKALKARRERIVAAAIKTGLNGEFFRAPDMADRALAWLKAHSLFTNGTNIRLAHAAILDGWEEPATADVIPLNAQG